MAKIKIADTSDRVPETTGVGRCSPAIWIARYVDPQHRYTLANATNTRVDFETPLNMCLHATGKAKGYGKSKSGSPKAAALSNS
jgi:hypothetical protein